ncbi:FAD-dependent oxidoreductase [Achromobacter aloeverae]
MNGLDMKYPSTRMEPTAQQPWLPTQWDKEADIVVVGFGGAGAAAAVTAHDAGAKVLILEKAPEAEAGGNTRVSGQGWLCVDDVENAVTLLNALSGDFKVPQAMVRVWAEEVAGNNDWVRSIGGDPREHNHPPAGIEFPELPGSECVHKYHHGAVLGYSKTWEFLEQSVKSRGIEVLYETPGIALIQNGITKEILGIAATPRVGAPIHVKARKAVILTCGGFENNQDMIRDYLPSLPYCYTTGSPWNEGDGVKMSQAVGADLWHMNNYAGPSMGLKVPEYRTTFSLAPLNYKLEQPGGMICVGPDASRFCDEKLRTRHGKIRRHGQWLPMAVPCPMFMIFDHELFGAGPLYDKSPSMGWSRIVDCYDWSEDNLAELGRGWIRRASTLQGLAMDIGLSPLDLEAAVVRWNAHCAAGSDPDFGRSLMLAPLAKGPFYAVELVPSMLNTQGGPRRNEKAQIVQPDGTPIPRLYSAGELGSIYSYLYQGTGNIGECLAFGRVAANRAVAEMPWD